MDEDRTKGGRGRAEKLREQREAVEIEAREQLAEAVSAAVSTLVSQLEAENPADRIRAAQAILDRAWGKPRQSLEAAVTVEPTVVYPEIDPGRVLEGLAELGLIAPRRNGDGD
jgi:hypothetical protein